jgi:hypothetical protein
MKDVTEAMRSFSEAGVRLEREGGLLYVYLDTPEAIRLACALLPPTRRGVAPDGREVWVYRDALEGGERSGHEPA